MKLSLSLVLAAALFVPVLTGCDTEDADGVSSESSDVEEGQQPACEYEGAGNARYKEVVALAKRHVAFGCDSEDEVYQLDVLEAAQAAVEVCPGVGRLFAESEWAGAVRDSLGPLAIADLAGELQGDGPIDAEALQAALGRGQMLWSGGGGVYGSPFIYELRDGRYDLQTIVHDEATGETTRQVTETGTFHASTNEEGITVVSFETTDEGGETYSSIYVVRRIEDEDLSRLQLQSLDHVEGSDEEYVEGSILHTTNTDECSA